jgi:hypothetical protein
MPLYQEVCPVGRETATGIVARLRQSENVITLSTITLIVLKWIVHVNSLSRFGTNGSRDTSKNTQNHLPCQIMLGIDEPSYRYPPSNHRSRNCVRNL